MGRTANEIEHQALVEQIIAWLTVSALPLAPTIRRVVRLADDDGTAIILKHNPHYVALEVYDDGTIVAAYSDRVAQHLSWEVESSEAGVSAAVDKLLTLDRGSMAEESI